MLPTEMITLALAHNDNQVFLICDDVNKGRVSFDDPNFQDCISIQHMRGNIELLRICAKHLTNSQKDFHIVNSFIDELESISESRMRIAESLGNIEVVE